MILLSLKTLWRQYIYCKCEWSCFADVLEHELDKDDHLIIDDVQDDNNNDGLFSPEVEEKQKNYYWKTEERDGIRYNTLKYKHSPSLDEQSTESETSTKSCCGVCQENCCTIFLLTIIIILVGVVISLTVWCFYLEINLNKMKIHLFNITLPSNLQSDKLESSTFFPDQWNIKQMFCTDNGSLYSTLCL